MNKILHPMRRRSLTVISAALFAGVFFVGNPKPAQAYIKCDVSDVCAETSRQQGQQTRQRISDMESNLVRVILESVERILGAMREQTGALTASEAQNTQAAGQNSQKVQQAADIHEELRRRKSVGCSATAPAQGGRSGGMTRPKGGGGKGSVANSGLSDQTREAIQNGVNQDKIPPTVQAKGQTLTGVGACIDFADPDSSLGKLCQQMGTPPKGKSPYLNADVDARTLFEGPDSINNGRAILSVPEEGKEAGARQAHLNMLFEASPIEMPKEEALKHPHLAGPFMGMLREYRASKDLASYWAKLFNRLTTIDPETKASLDALKAKDEKFYNEFFKGVDPKYHSSGVSPLTLLELQVESRVGNKDWLTRMSTATPEEKQNEQMAMQALDLRIQYQQMMAQYQTNVLLGKLLDVQVESTLRPNLDRHVEGMSLGSGIAGSQALKSAGGSRPNGN
jgi:hypothetical protein